MSRRKLGHKPPSIADMMKRTGRSPLSSSDSSSPNRGGRAAAGSGMNKQAPAESAGQTPGETNG